MDTLYNDLNFKSGHLKMSVYYDIELTKRRFYIMKHLHTKFTDIQVRKILERYIKGEIERKYIQEILGIKKSRFFALVKRLKNDPDNFTVQYTRKKPTRKLSKEIEKNIIKELKIERKLLLNKKAALKCYNYTYIKDYLKNNYNQIVSVPTIIKRAKNNGFYLKKTKKVIHAREVLTNHIGELVQYDSSHHHFSPYASNKWYLITSIDDFSRYLFYAVLIPRETSWAHITALEQVILKYGIPFSYYVDSHSIFRFVQKRDSIWRNHYKLTDDVDPQWKQVQKDCRVNVIYALSPEAKGKIERPYRWIQDRMIRSCFREKVSDINHAQLILNNLTHKYNYEWIHSTTKEIPYIRFQKAIKGKQSLFRKFALIPPFKSTKDIFCLRVQRTINAYRSISFNNVKFNIKNSVPHDIVDIRIYPLNYDVSELRFWSNNKLIDVQKANNHTLNLSLF